MQFSLSGDQKSSLKAGFRDEAKFGPAPSTVEPLFRSRNCKRRRCKPLDRV